ncbi:AMP-dependent synthetase and ligase [Candidatus Thiomargarita nelsonii]|uniref:AMP-dependent synthetase and ligase n=1 Tax=Candidatus Thiomargarita nelsonii TaxID=1003181 RepID=A0A176RSD5_9GAMM|nr:AMP-dependent synthetase and ligase [Candidatus Thiomargarita nelsonii]
MRPCSANKGPNENYLHTVDQICDFHCLIHDDFCETSAFDKWQTKISKPVFSVSHLTLTASNNFSEIDNFMPNRPDDIAILQFTSGSTGVPKGVIVTHGMMMAQLRHLTRSHNNLAMTPLRSVASWLPIHHDMGLFNGVLLPIYEGCNHLLGSPKYYMRNPLRWFSLLSEMGTEFTCVTNTSMVSACNIISRADKLSDIDLSNLHIYFGAEKLSPVVLQRSYQVFGPLGMQKEQFHVAYGMAENALGCSVTPRGHIHELAVVIEKEGTVRIAKTGDRHVQKTVSVGLPFSGYQISIHDKKGKTLPDWQLGEIWLRGDCVTPGYYHNRKATTEKINGSTFKTGDLGFIVEGELFFVARSDDILCVGGRNIVPDDVEQAVESLKFVGSGRTCVIGVEDEASGLTKPILLIEVSRKLSQEKAALWKTEVQTTVLEQSDLLVSTPLLCAKGTIEKTTSGKKRRKIIRQRYLDGMITGVNSHA